MKTISAPALAALAAGEVVLAGAAEFSFPSDDYRLWSGIGTLNLPGVGDFTGCGAKALIAPIAAELGGGVDGVKFALSGLEPAVAATIENEDYHQQPATVWRLIFNAEGNTLLDASVWFRGRVDTLTIRNAPTGEATIDVMIEGGGRDMQRRNSRRRSNADQRTLGGANDGGMSRISFAAEKTLYWGNVPARASDVNGGFAAIMRDFRERVGGDPFG